MCREVSEEEELSVCVSCVRLSGVSCMLREEIFLFRRGFWGEGEGEGDDPFPEGIGAVATLA